jgi:hypothetical protein
MSATRNWAGLGSLWMKGFQMTSLNSLPQKALTFPRLHASCAIIRLPYRLATKKRNKKKGVLQKLNSNELS